MSFYETKFETNHTPTRRIGFHLARPDTVKHTQNISLLFISLYHKNKLELSKKYIDTHTGSNFYILRSESKARQTAYTLIKLTNGF